MKEYIVLGYPEYYNPDLHYNSKHYSSLAKARDHADYINGKIFKLNDNGTIQAMKTRAELAITKNSK